MYLIKLNILLNIIFINSVQSATTKIPFDTVVSFGDSQSDTGNVYNLTQHQWPIVPPYYQGRFTNDRVWVERLGISNVIDYAYGDATIDNIYLIAGFTGPNKIRVPGIRQQIVNYLTVFDVGKVDLARTLYIIWASGNEYVLNSTLPILTVVDSLVNAINDLIVIGIQNIIVINAPPLQSFPAYNKDLTTLGTVISEHNSLLLRNITLIQSETTNVVLKLFDVHSIIANILSDNSTYTFNKVDKCWYINNYTVISQCNNSNDYVFIDDSHFTSVIHEILADNIRQFILSSTRNNMTSSKVSILVVMTLFIIKKFL